jgi:hypothetical protein
MLLATNLNYILWVIAKNPAELFYFEKVERLVHFKLKHHTRISTFLNIFPLSEEKLGLCSFQILPFFKFATVWNFFKYLKLVKICFYCSIYL